MGRIINEEDILGMDSLIELDGNKFNGKTVKEALSEDNGCIMHLLKKGLYFNDEVLNKARIKKIISNEKYTLDYNGIILYSTDWPEEERKVSKVGENVVYHEGQRDESYYKA